MSRINHPIQRRAAGRPVARRDRSHHRRGDPHIALSAVGPPTATVPVVHASSHDGFDRGDAGIRAAGATGTAMPGAGGGLVLVRMRRDHLDPATR
jgi:hypothetical protein